MHMGMLISAYLNVMCDDMLCFEGDEEAEKLSIRVKISFF